MISDYWIIWSLNPSVLALATFFSKQLQITISVQLELLRICVLLNALLNPFIYGWLLLISDHWSMISYPSPFKASRGATSHSTPSTLGLRPNLALFLSCLAAQFLWYLLFLFLYFWYKKMRIKCRNPFGWYADIDFFGLPFRWLGSNAIGRKPRRNRSRESHLVPSGFSWEEAKGFFKPKFKYSVTFTLLCTWKSIIQNK